MRIALPGLLRLHFFAALWVAAATPSAWALVISEIHYNPPVGQDGHEFVELTNDSSTPEDISGYSFVEGIAYTFPPGTVLGAYERVVVCVNAAAVRAEYGQSSQVALGNFLGRLDASGERRTLVNRLLSPCVPAPQRRTLLSRNRNRSRSQ